MAVPVAAGVLLGVAAYAYFAGPDLEEDIKTQFGPSRMISFPLEYPLMELSQRDVEELLSIVRTSHWSRKTDALSKIYVDYGRSHYYSIDRSGKASRAIHSFCFRNVDGVEKSEQEIDAFYDDLNIPADSRGDSLSSLCDDPTPRRNALITRVKYELLLLHLQKHHKKNSELLALRGLLQTTQNPLHYIKQLLIKHIHTKIPHDRFPVAFSHFQTSFHLKGETFCVTISFSNFVPQTATGLWQCHNIVPVDNPKCVTAQVTLPLEGDPLGAAVASVHIGFTHPSFQGVNAGRSRVQPKEWGLIDTDAGEVYSFRDTSPTW